MIPPLFTESYPFGDLNHRPQPLHVPGLTVHRNCPRMHLNPTEVTFALPPRYGIHTAREAHDWFLSLMREHEEFEVETDRVKNGARVGKHRSYERHSPKSGSGSA